VSPADTTDGAGDWRIRPARPADWAAACAVVAASALDTPPLLATAAAFDEAIASGGLYVATIAERVIGILGAQPIAYDGEKPYTLWIEVIAVHPAWRRQGIGTALYQALGRWANGLGVHGALTARADNPVANALHRQVGFVTHRDDLLLWRFDNLLSEPL
jgi:GNAT superfamily N-acetyltransferase